MVRDRLHDRPRVLEHARSRHVIISGDSDAGVLAFGQWVVEELRRTSDALAMYDFVAGRSHDVQTVLEALASSLVARGISCDNYLLTQPSNAAATSTTSISIGDGATVGRDLNPTIILNSQLKPDPAAVCKALLRDLESGTRSVTIALVGLKMNGGVCVQPSPLVWDILKILIFDICKNPASIHRVVVAIESAKHQDFPSYFKFHELGPILAEDCAELPENVKVAFFHDKSACSYESYVALLAKLELDESGI